MKRLAINRKNYRKWIKNSGLLYSTNVGKRSPNIEEELYFKDNL